MYYPKWMEIQVNIDKIRNIYKRTRTDELNTYIIEQDAYDFFYMFPDDDKLIPTVYDRIIDELNTIYRTRIVYTEEMRLVAESQRKECSSTDLERTVSMCKDNGIKVYTFENYLKEAFNLFMGEVDDSDAVNQLFTAIQSNPLLDQYNALPTEDKHGKMVLYSVYTYIVNAFLAHLVDRGTSAFPLQVEDFRKPSVLQAVKNIEKKQSEVPQYILRQLDINSAKVDNVFGGGNVYGF